MQFYTTKEIERKKLSRLLAAVSPHRNPSPNKGEQTWVLIEAHRAPGWRLQEIFQSTSLFRLLHNVHLKFLFRFRKKQNKNHSQVKRQIATRWKENLEIPLKRLFISVIKAIGRECVSSHVACLHFYFLDQVPSSTTVINNLCLETRNDCASESIEFQTSCENRRLYGTHIAADQRG